MLFVVRLEVNPIPLARNVACLDHSVAGARKLVVYGRGGENELLHQSRDIPEVAREVGIGCLARDSGGFGFLSEKSAKARVNLVFIEVTKSARDRASLNE